MANTVQFAGFYTLDDFNPETGEYVIGDWTATPWILGDDPNDSDLSDGTAGDGIEVAGDAVATAAQSNPTSVSTDTFTGWMVGTGVITQGSDGVYYLSTNDAGLEQGQTGTAAESSYAYPVCFLPGTRIATPDGECPIESLAIGDMVTLASGEQRPVKWVGRLTTQLHRFNRNTASPILIRAGAFGGGLPQRDLYTSYRHGFALEGVLVIAGLLINGRTVIQCTDWPEDHVTMYQIEVEGHELMLAEGAPTETFSEDGENRALFDNVAEYHALYPDAKPSEPMALGRVVVLRQLPKAVGDRISAAAAALAQSSKVA